MGGPSAEREVSLSSGRECANALRVAGYKVIEIELGKDRGDEVVTKLSKARPDVVFNALHGRWGEDGCVQGLLEWMSIPYTHSGVTASALAMDKTLSKELFRAAGIPVAQSLIAETSEVRSRHVMPAPYVVKPNNEGSSVGIYIVHEGANAPPQLSEAMPRQVLVESYIRGRDFTVAVMDGRALAVTEIITDGWYDYDAKYKPGGSKHVVPADIPTEITAACEDYAVRAFQALGCKGLARADFRWDDERGLDGLIILEINTQPGMTPTSLAPEQAAYTGMDFPELMHWMVEDALCRP